MNVKHNELKAKEKDLDEKSKKLKLCLNSKSVVQCEDVYTDRLTTMDINVLSGHNLDDAVDASEINGTISGCRLYPAKVNDECPVLAGDLNTKCVALNPNRLKQTTSVLLHDL